MEIEAIHLAPHHNGTVIRFTGKSGGLTYKTRMRLDYYITYVDGMQLVSTSDEAYFVDFDTLLELEENK